MVSHRLNRMRRVFAILRVQVDLDHLVSIVVGVNRIPLIPLNDQLATLLGARKFDSPTRLFREREA